VPTSELLTTPTTPDLQVFRWLFEEVIGRLAVAPVPWRDPDIESSAPPPINPSVRDAEERDVLQLTGCWISTTRRVANPCRPC
jgi:hypothetical protein